MIPIGVSLPSNSSVRLRASPISPFSIAWRSVAPAGRPLPAAASAAGASCRPGAEPACTAPAAVLRPALRAMYSPQFLSNPHSARYAS